VRRYKCKFKGAQLKLAATKSKPRPTFIIPQTAKPLDFARATLTIANYSAAQTDLTSV
jgi:hypothetical protein